MREARVASVLWYGDALLLSYMMLLYLDENGSIVRVEDIRIDTVWMIKPFGF